MSIPISYSLQIDRGMTDSALEYPFLGKLNPLHIMSVCTLSYHQVLPVSTNMLQTCVQMSMLFLQMQTLNTVQCSSFDPLYTRDHLETTPVEDWPVGNEGEYNHSSVPQYQDMHQKTSHVCDVNPNTDVSENNQDVEIDFDDREILPEWSTLAPQQLDLDQDADLRSQAHKNDEASMPGERPAEQRRESNSRSKCRTSAYAAELMSVPDGPGIVDYVRIYKKHSSSLYSTAYGRVRAKLTEELAEWLESDNDELVRMAVDIISRRKGCNKLTIEESKKLKKRMAPMVKKMNIEGKNVQAYGLPLYPDERIDDLLSKDEAVFTEAACLLLHCYD